jgi:hypothetical protein
MQYGPPLTRLDPVGIINQFNPVLYSARVSAVRIFAFNASLPAVHKRPTQLGRTRLLQIYEDDVQLRDTVANFEVSRSCTSSS